MGKIKLAEAYLEKGQIDKAKILIKEGWTTTDKKMTLDIIEQNLKNLLTYDHIKRADYLAWERKGWDLKRMLNTTN